MPIVATDAIRQGYLRLGAQYNDIADFSKPADWKFQTTTPNASTHYIYSAYRHQAGGPAGAGGTVAASAGIYGQLCDMWDVPLEIVGSGGEDKGQGGRYLILPPDFKGNVPAGYFPVRQQTYGGFWLLRTIPKSDSQADQNAAIALLKKIRMYPLSKTGNPPAQRFIDVSGKLWDGYPRIDASFYPVLAKMVNEEPVLPRDLAMMIILRSIGIEKGKGFKPEAATTEVLNDAIKDAHVHINSMQRAAVSPYWEGTHWSLPDTSALKTEFSFQDANMLELQQPGSEQFLRLGPPKNAAPNAPTIYILAYDDDTDAPAYSDVLYVSGDVARYPDHITDEKVRIEHWVVAERHGQAVARSILGIGGPFRDVPFFWSQHYDVAISYVGHAPSWESCDVRGDFAARNVCVIYRRNGGTAAVATIERDHIGLAVEADLERGDRQALEAVLQDQ